jgi:hypothetical protein
MPVLFLVAAILLVAAAAAVTLYIMADQSLRVRSGATGGPAAAAGPAVTGWTERARLVSEAFRRVYTPCWEGAYGAFGDAKLFETTGDSSILLFHTKQHDLTAMCAGTWVDDRAWVCLAELEWWKVTGNGEARWIADAARRYDEARSEGRLSNHEGFWSWYNWRPGGGAGERIFTNGNMNQMAAVACGLFAATGRKKYLDDALLVWNGDSRYPGVEAKLYRGNGRWEGRPGRAAFGKELPWGGLEYASIGAALYRATGDRKYREIAVATARRILDPGSGWVDPEDFYQLAMDGNGNFVQFLLDAREVAPEELADVPAKVGKMLDHVWTNARGTAAVTLHREHDHGIRNGWNPLGGEDGYGVDEVGTVHAQGEAAKAFGYYANVAARLDAAAKKGAAPREDAARKRGGTPE